MNNTFKEAVEALVDAVEAHGLIVKAGIRFCPTCKAEYQQGVLYCPAHGDKLTLLEANNSYTEPFAAGLEAAIKVLANNVNYEEE